MKVLHTTQEIRNAVRDVLDDASSNRYAFVAFVGADPLRWLPDPQGLQVFCWPRAGGTNPEGIDALVNAGAVVHFKESLHSKVYHSDARGTVIGSANLSDNALGSGRLTETAIKLPAGIFSLDEQLKLLEGATASDSPDFTAMMEKLRREHVAYYQRNPEFLTGEHAPKLKLTFGQWADLNKKNRSPWQLGLWSEQANPPQDVLEDFQAIGGIQFSTWRAHSNEKNIEVHVATLECQFRADGRGIMKKNAEWWFPEFQRLSTDAHWTEMPHVWFARNNVPNGVTEPFDCTEQRFLDALDRIVRQCSEKIDDIKGPIGGEFLELLIEEYQKDRKKMGNDLLEKIFQLAHQVDREEIVLKQAVDELVNSYGLDPSSAKSTINSISQMLNGKLYTRTLTLQITEFVLSKISEDNESHRLPKALKALVAHIEYQNSLQQSVPGLRAILGKFSK